MNSQPVQTLPTGRRELGPATHPPLKRRLAGVLALSALALLGPAAAQAAIVSDFQGGYAGANWNATSTADGGSHVFTGMTDLDILGPTGLPTNVLPGYYQITITVPAGSPTGNWTFDWAFSDPNSPSSNVGGYVLGITQTPFSGTSGNASFAVSGGDTIGFYVFSDSASLGQQPQLTITNFSAPAPDNNEAPVPEPASLWLLAAGAAGFSMSRRRNGPMEKSAA